MTMTEKAGECELNKQGLHLRKQRDGYEFGRGWAGLIVHPGTGGRPVYEITDDDGLTATVPLDRK